jgi:hypothetical protein
MSRKRAGTAAPAFTKTRPLAITSASVPRPIGLCIKNGPGSSPIQIATGDGVTAMRGVRVRGCEIVDCGEVTNPLVGDISLIYVDADVTE